MPRQGRADAHRPARRRDEGVGAGGALATCAPSADTLGIPSDFLEKTDIHIHVPAGAIPKDGPSAGRHHRSPRWSRCSPASASAHDVAMTGEITLRGQVLPVGGIKEKVLAAHRAGIKRDHPAGAQREGPGRRPRAGPQGAGVRLRHPHGRGAQGGARGEPGRPQAARHHRRAAAGATAGPGPESRRGRPRLTRRLGRRGPLHRRSRHWVALTRAPVS